MIYHAYQLSRRLKTKAAVRGKLTLGGREPEYEIDEGRCSRERSVSDARPRLGS